IAEKSMRHAIGDSPIAAEQLFQCLPLSPGKARKQALITGGGRTWCGGNRHKAAGAPEKQTAERASLFTSDSIASGKGGRGKKKIGGRGTKYENAAPPQRGMRNCGDRVVRSEWTKTGAE